MGRGPRRWRERIRQVSVPERQRVYPHAPVFQRLHGAGLELGRWRLPPQRTPQDACRACALAAGDGHTLEPQPPQIARERPRLLRAPAPRFLATRVFLGGKSIFSESAYPLTVSLFEILRTTMRKFIQSRR